MKKLILTFVLILTGLTAYTQSHVRVEAELKPFWNKFVRLMEENDIRVDYSDITAVSLVPLGTNLGYWDSNSGTVMINMYYQLPPRGFSTEFENFDMIWLTLAHEIGHAQGWEHTDAKYMGLMNPSSHFDLRAIRGMGAKQYILNTYKAKLCN